VINRGYSLKRLKDNGPELASLVLTIGKPTHDRGKDAQGRLQGAHPVVCFSCYWSEEALSVYLRQGNSVLNVAAAVNGKGSF
jgi:hypothetical protein